MASQSLPATLDFHSPINYLPDGCSSTLMSLQSTNGISYQASQVIQWDLPSRAGLYIDPKSVFIRYKITYTNSAAPGAAPIIKRRPVYTTFSRLDEFCGSTPLASVYQYNQVATTWLDLNMNMADLYGQQWA